MTAGLTRMQSRTLAFIERYIAENGVSPAYDEIMAELGLASKSGVNRIIVALEERGRIRRIKDRARSIEIIEEQGPHFHLRKILIALCEKPTISRNDPIIRDACAAMRMGGTP